MKAIDLYTKLDADFKVDEIGAEEWNLDSVQDYVSETFKKRYEGIMYDNTQIIQKVFTMTFPDSDLVEKVIDENERNILLFSHHAQSWTSEERNGEPFISMDNLPKNILQKMKEQEISLYSLHIPLDNFSNFSTGKCLAEALNVQVSKGCALYLNALTGVLGKTSETNITELKVRIDKALGHESKLYAYGSNEIKNSNIGILTGWGLDLEVLEEIHEAGINTYITGFTHKLPLSKELMSAHKFADENKINLIGTTHYSSEKFACIAMTEYFMKLGIPAEFMEGQYSLFDL